MPPSSPEHGPPALFRGRSARARLEDSLERLRREQPSYHAALAARAPLPARFEVEGEAPFVLVPEGGALRVESASGPSQIRVCLRREALDPLLRGERSLLASLASGDLEIYASTDALLAAEEALHLFLHGAARSPSFFEPSR